MTYYPGIGEQIAGVFGAIGDVRESWREREQQQAFKEAARSAMRPDGSIDYNKLAGALMQFGDVRGAMSVAEMGYKDAERRDEREWRRGVTDMFGGGSEPAPSSGNIAGDDYFSRVAQIESGGRPDAKNPRSSATGLYQFTTGTWNSVAGRAGVPPIVAGAPDPRNDPNASERAMRVLTERNAKILRSAKVPVTNGTLYMAHLMGPGGAVKTLKANPDASMAEVAGAQAVAANPGLFSGTVRDFVGRMEAKLGSGGGFKQPVQVADASGAVPIPADPATTFARGQRGQTDLRSFIASLPGPIKQSLALQAQTDPEGALQAVTELFTEMQERRRERRKDRREERRKAPEIETIYDPVTGREQKVRWNPRTRDYEPVGGVKAQSGGTRLTVGPNGEVQFEQGNTALGTTATSNVQQKAINAAELGSRVASIAQSFTPDDFTIGTRFANMFRSGKAKIDPSMLGPGEAEALAGFASRRSGAIENINRILNELSGAAVSPAEAERLKAAQPNPGTGIFDGDDPVTFKAKMERVLRDTQAALIRYQYYQLAGIPGSLEEIPLTDVQQVGGKWYVKKDGKVFEIGSTEPVQ